MTLASGLGTQFGLTKEATYGTQLAATKFFEIDSAEASLDQAYQDGVGLKANRMFAPAGRMRATTRQGAVSTPMDVPTKGFGAILDLMHGLTPTVVQQEDTDAYLQTHIIGTSMPNKSATLQLNKPTTDAVDVPTTYPGSILTAASFAIDAAGLLKATLTWDAMDERTPATTPAGLALAAAAYPTGVTSWLGTVTVVITMNGVPVATCQSMTLDWAQGYRTDRWFLGSGGLKKRPIPNALQAVTGNLELEWFDTTAYALFRSGAKIAVSFDFANDVIEDDYLEQIVFALSDVQLRGGSPGIQGPDVLAATVPYVAGDNGTDPPLQITYQSTDTAI
ncbi:MAG: phage tail tube protein [Solirubrobacteraceae bacterium]|nr:phage tail tube protein [Solirubrobacteraceae bacterium]